MEAPSREGLPVRVLSCCEGEVVRRLGLEVAAVDRTVGDFHTVDLIVDSHGIITIRHAHRNPWHIRIFRQAIDLDELPLNFLDIRGHPHPTPPGC
jgi:hypothetical protein